MLGISIVLFRGNSSSELNLIFDTDNIIEKVVCSVFYAYIFDFITYFYNTFINIKLLLIHYLCRELVIIVFVLLNIL